MLYKGMLAAGCSVAALMATPITVRAQVVPDAPPTTAATEDDGQDRDPAATTGDPVPPQRIDAKKQGTGRASEGNDIIVTGTRIVRPNNASAAPITTTTSAEIAAQGATTIEEVLNRLPQVQANAEQNYAESNGQQRIKLRSLGFERTLTLVDGMRLGIQNGMDVSIIPNALVDRVDVLSGGASSVYGSDAVSGVVNFVLKKNYDGVTLTGNYSFFNHENRSNVVSDAARSAYFPVRTGMVNDGGRAALSVTAGKTLFNGAVNITGFAAYRASNQISLGDRSVSACEVTQTIATGALNCTRSTYTAAGTILPQAGANARRTLVNDPNGSGGFVPYNSGPGTAVNPYDDIPFQRNFTRINTGAFLRARISSDIELYSTALFYRDRSYNTLPNRLYSYTALSATPYQVNCDNPFLSGSQRTTLCGAQTTGLVPLDVRYRFDGLPLVENRFENKGVRVAAGLRGRVLGGAWSYDLGGVYSRGKSTSIYPAFPNYDRVNNALNVVTVNGRPTCVAAISGSDRNCVPFNAFRPFNNDAAAAKYMFLSVDGTQSIVPLMWQGLAVLSGDLGKYGITSPFANQGVALAFGSEFRSESFTSTADAQYRASNGGEDVTYRQSVWEVNSEVQVPLIEKRSFTDLLQVNGGYRLSRYNRLQGQFSTWKVEGLWAPVTDVTFRASFNKAQRAPTVIQADQARSVYYVTNGSRNDPCASSPDPNSSDPKVRLPPTATLVQCRHTGLPDSLYGSADINCPDQLCTIRNGGFGLKPETAYTKTFGVVLRPRWTKGLTFSADRFVIDLKDSINYFPAADFLDGCLLTGLDYYCRGVVRNPGTYTLSSAADGNPATGWIAQGTSNGYKQQSHGWDFQSQYAVGLGAEGALELSFNGSLMTYVGGQDSPDVPPRNCVGYYGIGCGESMPKWKHGLRLTWGSADQVIHVSGNWRHIAPMTITYNADAATGIPVDPGQVRRFYTGVAAYDYIDLSLSFDVAKRFTVRASVNNLFDRDPPIVPDSRSTLGLLRANTMFNYDLLGRQIVVGATTTF